MVKPAPYSNTDPAEQDAVNTFRSLIDSRFVKEDIRTRDKYPNVDGTLELVDQDQYPIGKLDVQIRKISAGATKYPCPMSLVAYSKISILPVLIICVDTDNKCAFWRHVSFYMPEYKEGQKSFMISFDEISNSIDDTGIYLQKWQEIVSDYQQRIAKYPAISDVAGKISFDDIGPKDKIFFQRYIETVNDLLDRQFPMVKDLMFPGVWKLGVGIHTADQRGISYRIYRIPYGNPIPLVSRFHGRLFDPDRFDESEVGGRFVSRDGVKPPIIEGQEFVYGKVKHIFEKRDFPVKGILLSSDILISFIDDYAHCLGVSLARESYTVGELNRAFNQYFLAICGAIVSLINKGDRRFIHLDLDWVSGFLSENEISPADLKGKPISFSLGSQKISVKNVFDSLQYLLANNVSEISRPFARFTPELLAGGGWIWSGYAYDDEVRSVVGILSKSIAEYTQFVEVNRFAFPKSPYLNPSTSIVFEYFPSCYHEYGPELREFHIDDSSHQLPKVKIFIGTKDEKHVDVSSSPLVSIDDNEYECKYRCDSVADLFFRKTPVQSLLYRMLAHDLGEHYEISDIRMWR